MRTTKLFWASLLATGTLFLPFQIPAQQDKPAVPPPSANAQDHPELQHMHQHANHGGFMQEGMHHAIAKGVTLNAKVDAAAHAITLHEGPMNLPAHTSHGKMPQPPDLVWTVPLDGWLLAYTPKLVDAAGKAVPGQVLHHTAFWNENRADFLCPNKEEHIFGAGSEMTPWMPVLGYGYRVQKGDKIRIETMVYNPTETSYDKVYLEVLISYQDLPSPESAATLKSYYPAWMDVKSCGDSSYDLAPGKTEEQGAVVVKFSGALLGVGGHMHDYAKQIVLEDVSRKETVAALDAHVDAQGRLESIPTKTFFDQGGYKFAAGDVLKISATYDNPTGKLLRDGAMGIVVGYFVPADDAAMSSLRRQVTPTHGMPRMSHDH
jgi:hypothetical protein